MARMHGPPPRSATPNASFPDPRARAGTVIVGMSGGVDSAVAALLLRDVGYAVQGLFMSNWEDDDDAYCTTADDFQDARRVCDALGHRPASGELCRAVPRTGVRAFPARIRRGPNPESGRSLQSRNQVRRVPGLHAPSGGLLDRHRPLCAAAAHGRRTAAAEGGGHGQGSELFLARRRRRPRSAKTLFPIGDLRKAEVRKLAHAAGLPVYDKPDSTGICFIGERPFQEFLSRYLHTEPGPIENDAGVRHRRASRPRRSTPWASAPG